VLVFREVLPEDGGEHDKDGEQPDEEDHGRADVGLGKLEDNGVSTALYDEEDKKGEEERIAGGAIEAQEEEPGDEGAGDNEAQEEVIEIREGEGAH